MFTHRQYLNNEISHREYYAQFITEDVKALVLDRFSLSALKNAGENFNTISLKQWDILTYALPIGEINAKMKQCGDTYALGIGVCILKEAARQLCDEAE